MNMLIKDFHKTCLISILIVSLMTTACVTVPAKKKRKSVGTIKVFLAEMIVPYAISIDAKHYTELDSFLPKYKILTIAITNRSLGTLELDPLKDVWKIQDARGHWYKATNSLQIKDPESWKKIPEKMQKLIAYPGTTPPGFTQTFDIFFPSKVDPNGFRALEYRSDSLKQKFLLIPQSSPEG